MFLWRCILIFFYLGKGGWGVGSIIVANELTKTSSGLGRWDSNPGHSSSYSWNIILCLEKQRNHQGRSLPLPRFSRSYLGGTTEGTGNMMGQCLGNMGDGVRPGSQGIRGFPLSPSLCGVPRCCEGGTAGIAMSYFRKVGATSPSRSMNVFWKRAGFGRGTC